MKLKVHRFIGVSLAGGKTDKTALAIIEYFPKQNKIFLSRLFEKVKPEGEISSDAQIQSLITSSGDIEAVAFDVPLKLPVCLTCKLKCPGYESCKVTEIQWMWKHYRKRNEKKKPKKIFTPYTERCVEQYLTTELEEPFHMTHALGANLAPLTARALFIKRRLKTPVQEVFPKLSLWRIGRNLGIQKSHLRFHKHSVGGEESRRAILDKLIAQNVAFLYDQDTKILTENSQAFDAFICGLTAVLSFRGQTEGKPKDFPKSESWIEIPKLKIVW